MRLSVVTLALAACASQPEPAAPAATPLPSPSASALPVRRVVRARLPGGAPIALAIEGAFIRAVAPNIDAPPDVELHDLGDAFVVPAFIDSHVHLAYLPQAPALASRGIAAAVDMAAPPSFSAARALPLQLAMAGPMITSLSGYPTQEWGENGYGLECADAAAAVAAVDAVAAMGARLVKVPVSGTRGLDDDALVAVVQRAHALGLRVAAHALADVDARRAGEAGVDILAHTPLEPLSDEAVAAFADRTVISTLAAFGGGPVTLENLRRLRAAGARVLYGTDFGNTRDAGIQRAELRLLAAAGLDPRAILRAGTEDAAAFWGFSELGALESGRRASFVVLSRDPLDDIEALATPSAVWLDGAPR